MLNKTKINETKIQRLFLVSNIMEGICCLTYSKNIKIQEICAANLNIFSSKGKDTLWNGISEFLDSRR